MTGSGHDLVLLPLGTAPGSNEAVTSEPTHHEML